MSDTLLPPNATNLELALEATTARISDVPILVRESWNPETCPVALLPWLAWAFSVDEWDATWTEEEKRQAIRDAYDLARVKGTVWAVKRQLSLLSFPDALLDEGLAIDELGVSWAHYRVRFSQALSAATAERIARALESAAPKRSQLWSIDFTDAADVPLYDGTLTANGEYTHGEYA